MYRAACIKACLDSQNITNQRYARYFPEQNKWNDSNLTLSEVLFKKNASLI